MVDGIHFLGIRHHGPGSAKNVKAYLEELEPDIILLEGPPEAEPLLAGRVLSFCRVLTGVAVHVLCC